jgi:CHASE2 domain-containing sensor protein
MCGYGLAKTQPDAFSQQQLSPDQIGTRSHRLILLLAFSGVLERTDRWWFDTLQAFGASRAPLPAGTAMVLIDEQSLTTLGQPPFAMRWPWPRAAFAALVTGLQASGAKAIAVDLV